MIIQPGDLKDDLLKKYSKKKYRLEKILKKILKFVNLKLFY